MAVISAHECVGLKGNHRPETGVHARLKQGPIGRDINVTLNLIVRPLDLHRYKAALVFSE